MNVSVETLIQDVKSRTDVAMTRGQQVLETGVETLMTVKTLLVEGVQELVQAQVSAGKELVERVQSSVEKARADGLKAVASNPTDYLPEGKTTMLGVYHDSVALLGKTGDELVKTLKSGVDTISAELSGATPGEKRVKMAKPARKAHKAVKKPVRKATKSVKDEAE